MTQKGRMTKSPASEKKVAGRIGRHRSAGLGEAFWFGTDWMVWMNEVGAEFSGFVSERIREDVRTQHAILGCKDPSALQEIQKTFVERAIEDYAVETGKMIEISNRILSHGKPEEPTS